MKSCDLHFRAYDLVIVVFLVLFPSSFFFCPAFFLLSLLVFRLLFAFTKLS